MNTKRLSSVTYPVLVRLLSHPSSGTDLSLAWDVFAFDSLHFARRFRHGAFLGFSDFRHFCEWFVSQYARSYIRLGGPSSACSIGWVCQNVSDWICEEVDR